MIFAAPPPPSSRPILVTVDDLPMLSESHDGAERAAITRGMLAAMKKHGIRAIGFVTGKRVGADGEKLLVQWLDAGHELGNHTLSHESLDGQPAKVWIADAEAERVALEAFLTAHGKTLRFFRHPFLEEGDTREKLDAVRAWLAKTNQRNVDPTVDDQDWWYEKPFVEARRRHDAKALRRIEEDYLAALRLEIESQEERGDALFGRRTPQILLLHATEIGAKQWDGLFTWLEETGHRFATADEVLADPAFATAPAWIGPHGFGAWDRMIALRREERAKADVAALLAAQAAAWTAGDLDSFCSVYADDATFVSPSGITHGREQVLARYRAKYPDRAAMGALSLEVLESRVLAGIEINDLQDVRPGRVQGATVVAKWTLTFAGKPPATGSTQLVLRPRGGSWEILSDASM